MHKSRGKLPGVLHKGFKPDKCKTSLRMAVARIKLLRNRKEVAVRQMRREVAQLLEANQDQTARIRVEHVIREEKFMQSYDLIEVYCELIVARLSIIDSQKTCPIDLKEAIASVIFASMRCADVTELVDVRKHFTSKYGKEFAAAALEVRPDSGVNRLVIEKLSAGAPDVQTKIKTLTSIAEEHNIKWEPKAFEEKLQKPDEDRLHGPTTYYGANISTMGSSTPSMSTPQPAYPSASVAAVDSAASHVPMGPYSPAGVSEKNASLEEDRMGSKASAPLSSQYSASTYYSAQIPGSNNFSHENPGGSVSRPYSQYDTSAPGSVSRDEEINQPRGRKSSVSGVSGANWNMEFKDATSAAQAAAESAEMASIAARAAAQLASRGNYSGEHSTGGFESGAYNHQNTPRKQTAAHFVKDEKRSFSDQSSRTDDPRMISSDQGKHSTGAETSHPDSQNLSTDYSPSQDVHSYNSESHTYVYGMPVEPPRAHSPEPPHSDDLYDRESNIGRRGHPMDFSGEKFQDTALGGRNVSDVNNEVSSDHASTDDYYGNYSSSHGTFTHGTRTVWDNQTDKTQVNPSSVVFDQYDSDVEEENLFDAFTSKHTEQLPGVHDNMESSNADWSQQHRNDSPSNDRTSDLFSRTETQNSDTSEANRRYILSPRSYDNLPPTFDLDGDSSDEEIAASPTLMHAEILRSHSKGSTNSRKIVRDVNESIEDYYESSSGKKSGTSSGLNVSYKEQLDSGHSPRYDYSRAQAQRNFSRVQSRDSDISDEESEPEADKLKVASPLRGNENQSLPFAQRTSATFDGKDEGDFGLNFSRLTPGLRNKPKQPPPYPKSSRENVLPRQSLNKVSASVEEPVDSEEDTTFEPIRSTTKSSRATKTSSGGGYSSELYDRNPSVETPKEARSTMARNSFHSDDAENLSEQFGNASLIETKGSEHRNPAQEFYQQKPDIGGRRQMRPRMAKNFFDSDDSDQEVGQRQAPQSKWSAEQITSRRTREVTSGAKRDGLVQTRAQYADESESMPKETRVTQAFSNSNVEQWTARPDASVAVQRPSTKTERNESTIARGKLQKDEIDTRSVPANENTETSGTPKESTSKTAAAHVHPKLPTDYDSFAAHFKSLRTNRR